MLRIFPCGLLGRSVAIFAFLTACGSTAHAQTTYTWSPNTTGNWSVAGNWSGSAPATGGSATDIVNFNGTTGAAYTSTDDLNGQYQLNKININNIGGVGVFTLATTSPGTGFTFGGVSPILTVASTNTQAATISAPITLTSGAALANYSGALLTIGGNVTNGANTLTFVGAGASGILVTGVLGAGAGGLTVGGAGIASGTVTLTNNNLYTGTTTLANNGTLLLDFSQNAAPTTATNIINASSILTLGGVGNGGTLSLNGGGATATNSQTFVSTTLNAGASAVTVTLNGANSVTATLGAITRNTGSTVDFGTTGTINTTTANGAGGTLGGYSTFGGTTWAVGGGNITGLALASYTSTYAGTTATSNFDATAGGTFTTLLVNSIRFNNGAAAIATAAGTTVISTGGILVTSGVGAAATSIGANTIATGNGKDLIVINNSSGTLTISSIIAGGAVGLTKSGTGNLTLAQGVNTFTGGTIINAGTVTVTVAGAAGKSAFSTGAVTINQGATLVGGVGDAFGFTGVGSMNINGGTVTDGVSAAYRVTLQTLNFTGGSLVTASGGTGDANGGSFSSQTGVFNSNAAYTTATISGDISGANFTRSGTLSLQVAANSFNIASGFVTTGATPGVDMFVSSVIGNYLNIAGAITKTGTGVLEFSGTNTYTGGTTISAGAIIAANNSALGTGAVVVNGSAGGSILNFTTAAATIGSLSGSVASGASTINLASASTLTISQVAAGTYAGTINGSATITLAAASAAVLNLTGTNNYTGNTTISGGGIEFNANVPTLGTVTVNAGGAAVMNFTGVQASLAARFNAASAGSIALTTVSSAENIDFSAGTGVNFTAAYFGANGTVTYTGTFTPNGPTYQLGGGGGTLNFSALITGSNSVIIGPAGGMATIVNLTGANTFNGGLTVANNTLSFATVNTVPSGAATNLGTPTTAVNGTINLGSTTFTGGLSYVGTGSTTDRVINLAGTTGGGVLDQSGTGLIKYTGNMNFSGSGAKTLTLSGSTAGTGEFSGIIAGGIAGSTSPLTIAKTGTGSWLLSGTGNTATTLTLAGGTLDTGTNGIGLSNLGASIVQASANSTLNGKIILNSTGGAGNGPDFGAATGVTLTVNAVIASGSQGAIDYFNATVGTTILAANNTYTGQSNIAAQVVQVTTINNSTNSLGSSSLGAPSSVANAILLMGNGTNAGTLKYVGTGETTDRGITLNGSTGGAVIDQSGTNLLKFLGGAFTAIAGIKTITFQGSTTGTGEFDPSIVNSAGTISITKAGTGTWLLGGNNSSTGAVTISGGTLAFSGSNASTFGVIAVGAAGILQLQAVPGNTTAGTSNVMGYTTGNLTSNGGITAVTGSVIQLRSDGTVTFGGTNGLGGLNANVPTIDVNRLTGSGTAGSVLSYGLGGNQYGNVTGINVTGGNGYSLALGVYNDVTAAANGTFTVTPTTASVSIAGFQSTVSSAFSETIVLAGTSTGNSVGAILAGTGATQQPILVTKSGTSTWTMSGVNTYTGATTVSAGTLILTGTMSGTAGLSIAAAGQFTYTPTTQGTTLTVGGATTTLTIASGGTISSTFGSEITVQGAATLGAIVYLAPTGTFTSGTTYNVLGAASGLGTTSYIVLNPITYTYTTSATATLVTITPTTATALTNAYWVGGLTNATKVWSASNGSTASNWTTDGLGTATPLVPGSGATVTFSDVGALAANQTGMTLGANMSLAGIVVNSANPVGLSDTNFSLTLGTGGITINAAAGTATLTTNLILSGAQSWTNSSASLLTIASPISTGSSLLTLTGNGAGGTTVSGIISGSAGLTKSGNGLATLTGVNTFTGTTTVSGGMLAVTGAGNITTSTALSVAAGAQFTYSPTVAGTAMTLAASSTLTLASGSAISSSFGSTIGVLGAATTTGTIYLTPIGVFTSGTTYNVLSAASGLNTASYTILNPTNFTSAVNATSTLVQITPTTATALTTAFWLGGLSGNPTMWAASNGSTASNWSTNGTGTATPLVPGSAATITFSDAVATLGNQTGMTLGANMAVAGIVVNTVNPVGLSDSVYGLSIGTGGITVNAGAGAVTFSPMNTTMTGIQSWTNNSLNTLTIGSGVSNGGFALTVTGSGNTTISNSITGTGALTKTGAGTLALSGANFYTGATTVNNGTLSLSGSLANTNITVNNATALSAAAFNETSAGVVSGAGTTVTMTYGNANLAGANTYTGLTTIGGGTLNLTGSLNSVSAMTFTGTGTFNANEAAGSSQSLGALNFNFGEGTVQSTYGGSGNTTLTYASLARASGGTGNLVSSGGTNGTTNKIVISGATSNALINPGVFFNGNTYAWYDSTGFVRAVNYASDTGAATSGTTTTVASIANQQVTGAITAQTTAAFTTFNIVNASNVTLAAAQTVTVNSILKTGGGTSIISGGTGLTTTGGSDFIFRADTATDIITVSSALVANGTNALVMSGGLGKVTLGNATNNFTGDIYINGGILEASLGNAITGAFGTGSTSTYKRVNLNGGTFRLTSTLNDNTPGAANLGLAFIVGTGGGTIDVAPTFSLTLDDGSGAGILNGNAQLQGVGNLTKIGTGTLILGNGTSNFNSFTGRFFINVGTVQLGSGTFQLGDAVGDTVIAAGAVLNTSANSSTENITINGTAAPSLVNNGATNSTLSGTITLGSNSSIGGTGILTLSTGLTGSFALTKVGAGTLILSGVNNNYTGGTTVSAGVLQFNSLAAVPSVGTISVPNTGTLALNNFSTSDIATTLSRVTVASAGVLVPLGTSAASDVNLTNYPSLFLGAVGSITYTGAFTPSSTAVANLGGGTGTLTFNQNLLAANVTNVNIGPVGGTTGTVILGGTSTYSGTTTIDAGAILSISAAANIGASANTVAFNGGTLQITGTTLNNLTSHTFTFANNANVTFDINNVANTFTLDKTASIGTGIFTKQGAGTLTLSNPLTLTGNIVVSNGTLNVNGTVAGSNTTTNLNYGASATTTVVNVASNMTIFQRQGSQVGASVAVYNQTAGTVNASDGTGDTGYISLLGYGAFNLTGGTFNESSRFEVVQPTNAAAVGVVNISGTGTLNQNNGEWAILAYNGTGSLTVGPGGSFTRVGASQPFGIVLNKTNAYGVFNVAGGTVDTGAKPIQFGNGVNINGTSSFVNVAGGTLTIGTIGTISFGGTSASNNAYYNFAGGTVRASAVLNAGFVPATAGGLTVTSTIFGAVNNSAATGNTTQNFVGGLTIDTNNNAVTLANTFVNATGSQVTQANLTVTGGSNYVGAPMVQFSSAGLVAGGTPAAGYALISGGALAGIVITDPGTYTAGTIPTITLTGGGGSGASVVSTALNTANTSGGLTKIGQGTLTLSAANTYTGTTLVSAGTLSLSGSITGSSVNVNGSTAVFSETATGIVAGTGTTFTVTSGSAILANANTYTGATSVTGVGGNTLTVTGAGTINGTALSVGSGAMVVYSPTVVGTALATSSLTLGAGSIVSTIWSGGNSSSISAITATTAAGTVYLNPTGAFTSGTTYTVLTAGVGGDLQNGGLTTYGLLNPTNYTAVISQSSTLVQITPTSATPLTSAFWLGGLVSNPAVWAASDGVANSNWSSSANPVVATPLVPGATADVTFSVTTGAATNQTSMTLGTNMSIKSLTVNSTNPVGLNADSNTLTIAGASGITIASGAGQVNLNALLALGIAQQWTNNNTASSFNVGGNVANGGFLLTLSSVASSTTNISGSISGAVGGLTTTGAGIVTLSGANTFGGTTTIQGGSTVVIGAVNTLPVAGVLTMGDGTTAAIGTMNLAAFSQTTGAFNVKTNSATVGAAANAINIGTGQTLTTNGLVTIGVGAATTNFSNLTVAGLGTWTIGTSATPTNANIQLGVNLTTNISNAATVDLSGLTNFAAYLGTGTLFVGEQVNAGGTGTAGSTLKLAVNSIITAATISQDSVDGDNAGLVKQSIVLGTGTNAFNANTINIGLSANRAIGTLTFGTGSGSLTVTSEAGTANTAVFNVGYGATSGTGFTSNGNLVDLTGHTATLSLASLNVGGRLGNSAAGATATFKFDTGTLNSTAIIVGARGGTTAGATTTSGDLQLSGTGTTTIGTGGLMIGNNAATVITPITGSVEISGSAVVTVGATSNIAVTLGKSATASATSSATLSITGGTVTLAGDLVKGTGAGSASVTSTLTLNGGTLNMGGFTIGNGGLGAGLAIDTLNFQSGTLQNVAQINSGAVLSKTTTGTLTLAGINTYTGASNVTAGIVKLGSTTAINGTTSITVSNTAAVDVNGFTPGVSVALNLNGSTGTATVGALTNSSATAATYSGQVTLQTGSSIGSSNGNISLSNNIAGAQALTKVGSDTLILTGNTNASTTTTITLGTLQIGNATTTGTLGSGAVTDNGTLVFNRSNAYSLLVANTINGSGGVTQSGAGTTTLNSTSGYNGATLISAGVLQGGVTSAFSNVSAVTITGSGKLDLGGFAQTILSLTSASNTAVVTNSGSTDVALTIANAGSFTYAGIIQNGATNKTALTLTTGALTLTGTSNTYAGATTINGGASLIGGAANAFSANSDVTINGNGILDLATFAQAIKSLTSASTTAVVKDTGVGAAVLTISNGGSYAGKLLDDGPLGLTLTGGTLTLSGVLNVNSGPTTLQNAAVLQGGAANAFSPNSAVTLANAATLDMGGFNQAIPSLSGSAATFVTNSGASGTNTLTLSNSNTTYAGTIKDGATAATALTLSAGSFTATGTNTYTGATSVNGGTLLVNGNSSGATGAVSVAGGASLGGTGTVGGATTVSGTLFTGTDKTTVAGIGQLNVNASVTLNDGSTHVWKVGNTAGLGAGNGGSDTGTQDRLNVTGGTNSITNGSTTGTYTFKIVEVGPGTGLLTTTSNYSFTIATTAGTPTFVNASNITFDTSSASDFANYVTANGASSISLISRGNNEYLQLTTATTPEPHHILLLCVSFLLLGVAIRRRMKAVAVVA